MGQNLFSTAKRSVYCMDANEWLRSQRGIVAIVTSLPDVYEIINVNKSEYLEWLRITSVNLAKALNTFKGTIVFYQSDRKYDGIIFDKKHAISSVFYEQGYYLVMSKIALRRAVGKIDIMRPTFTNVFAFSRTKGSGKATPDVFERGAMLYKNAMGQDACRVALDFIIKKTGTNLIVDPFCGQGTVLRMANDMGVDAIGVDIDEKQTRIAEII